MDVQDAMLDCGVLDLTLIPRMLDGDVTDAVEARSLSLNNQHIDIYRWGEVQVQCWVEVQGWGKVQGGNH